MALLIPFNFNAFVQNLKLGLFIFLKFKIGGSNIDRYGQIDQEIVIITALTFTLSGKKFASCPSISEKQFSIFSRFSTTHNVSRFRILNFL